MTPPKEAEAPLALDAVTLFSRALAARGVRASPWSLLEALRGSTALTDLAECARQQGLEAEVLPLVEGDAIYIVPSSLVEMRTGELAIVISHQSTGTLIETASGTRHRVGPRGGAVTLTAALELRVSPPEGARFFERFRFRLRDEPHAARAVALGVVLALVLAILGLAGPVLSRIALGDAIPDRAEHTLAVVAGVTLLVGLQIAYVGWLRRRALLYLTMKLAERASVDVVAHALRLPYATLRKLDVGRARQAAAAATAAAEAIPTLAPQLLDAALGVVFLAYTFTVDVRSGWITAAAGLVLALLGVAHGRRHLERKRTLLTTTRAEQNALLDAMVGIDTVKSESAEGRMLARWLERLLAEEAAAVELRLAESRFSVLVTTAERMVFCGVLLLLAERCLSGAASVADLVAAVQASASFMQSAQKLAELPSAFALQRGEVERVDESLAQPGEKAASFRTPPSPDAPALVLRNVWFRYEEDAPWVLSGLDLVVPRGETRILSWPSGAGKSTLLRIISGLLSPSRGDALVYGLDAVQGRALVTYVPQQAMLFPMSITENIRVLSGGAPIRRILEAAEATGLLEIVSTWGMGMETVISLGGVNVSSGQKQLILLTAAVASETPLLLLDEALAHVDLATRARLASARLFEGRTVIAVVHDASAHERAGGRLLEAPGASWLVTTG